MAWADALSLLLKYRLFWGSFVTSFTLASLSFGLGLKIVQVEYQPEQ